METQRKRRVLKPGPGLCMSWKARESAVLKREMTLCCDWGWGTYCLNWILYFKNAYKEDRIVTCLSGEWWNENVTCVRRFSHIHNESVSSLLLSRMLHSSSTEFTPLRNSQFTPLRNTHTLHVPNNFLDLPSCLFFCQLLPIEIPHTYAFRHSSCDIRDELNLKKITQQCSLGHAI